MVDIKRPELLRSNDLRELLRWTKHTTDNIDQLAETTPYLAIASTSGAVIPSGTQTFLNFDTVQFSQGNTPVWDMTDRAMYMVEDGVYVFNYSLTWDALQSNIIVQRTSNMSVAHNSITARTAMSWSSVKFQEGSGITWSGGAPTRLTFARTGRVQLSTDLVLYDTAAGGWRETYWLKNGSTTNYYAYDLTPGGVYAGTSGSGEIDVVAGDYVELYLVQNQTAVASLNVLGSAANPAQGLARYVDNGSAVRASAIAINDYFGPDRATGKHGLVGACETYSNGYWSVNESALVMLSEGDKVQLRCSQSSGASLSVLSYPYVEFQMMKVG